MIIFVINYCYYYCCCWASAETDPLELSRQVGSDAALDCEGKNKTTGKVREQIRQILQQFAPERRTIHDVELRIREMQAAQERQIFSQENPAHNT